MVILPTLGSRRHRKRPPNRVQRAIDPMPIGGTWAPPPNHILGPRKEHYRGIGPVTPANAPANGGMPRNLEVTLPYFGNLKSHFRYVPALRRKRCDASGLSLAMHARRGKMRIPVRLTSSTRTGGREAGGSAHLFTPISPSRPGQGGGGARYYTIEGNVIVLPATMNAALPR